MPSTSARVEGLAACVAFVDAGALTLRRAYAFAVAAAGHARPSYVVFHPRVGGFFVVRMQIGENGHGAQSSCCRSDGLLTKTNKLIR